MVKHLLISSVLVFLCISINAQTDIKTPPNIVVILADDLGWADLSSYGSSFYETPNLDSLAAKGIRFTQNYSTCSVCSPTRSSMMTGKYPVSTGVTDWIPGRQANGNAKPYEKLIAQPTAYQLALNEKSIAEFALENNYKTFFAGKWHLGEEEKYWPQYHGFQSNLGGWGAGSPFGRKNDSTGGFFTPYKNPMLSDGPAGEYLTDRLTSECMDFIERNKQSPFLLMYSLYAVHNPMQAPRALIRKYQAKQKLLALENNDRFAKDEAWMKHEKDWKRRLVQDNPVYAAMIENMDWNIGRILDQLKLQGLDENTLVIFTSDNGGLSTAEGSPTTNAPLRGGKGWMYEGGIRVPLIMYWNGKIKAGLISDLPVTTADFFPTIANLINGNYIKDGSVDGEDIFAMFTNSRLQKRAIYWHYPHYSNQGGRPASAVRLGDYKLIYNHEDASVELYNLKIDLAEANNVASTNERKVKQLKRILFNWLRKTSALMPNKNPFYSTSQNLPQK